MNKQEITSLLTDSYEVWLKLENPQHFKSAIETALMFLDTKTVQEILSNFNLTGLDDIVEEAYKTVADMYKKMFDSDMDEGEVIINGFPMPFKKRKIK